MEELFDSYIFWIILGILLILIVCLVVFLVSKKRKKSVVNDVKDFNFVPELDQVMKENEVKPFSEQEFNRQLMSQVQGIEVNTSDGIEYNSENLKDINSTQEEVIDIVRDVPDLVPEFNSNGVTPQKSDNQISGTAVDFVKQVQSYVQPSVQGAPEFIPQSNIFLQELISNDSSVNSAVESIEIVDDSKSDEIVDVVEVPNDIQTSVSFNNVFGQSGNQENNSSNN